MNKIFVSILIGMALIGGLASVYHEPKQEVTQEVNLKYQGPVPLGYNLEHFRKNGETILLEVKE